MKYLKTFEHISEDIKDDFINKVSNDDSDSILKYIKKYKNEIVNFNYNGKFTPLMYAALYNSWKVATVLIQHGADMNQKDSMDETPLMIACNQAERHNHMDVIDVLIKGGADWNITKDKRNSTTNKKYFLDFLNDHLRNQIIKKYPEKYNDYLIKKDSSTYNL